MSSYIFLMTLNIFPLMSCESNFFHNPTLHTVSNALEKSIKQQNNLFFCALRSSIRQCNEKMLSEVE